MDETVEDKLVDVACVEEEAASSLELQESLHQAAAVLRTLREL